MPINKSVRALLAAGGLGAGLLMLAPRRPPRAQNDLDAFMQQVVARRDDNWKKLQQYVLDEREVLDLRGPGNTRMWGEDREYTWFIRDGFFIRSPLKFNGVTIGEDDRRKAEDEYLPPRAATRRARGGRARPTPTRRRRRRRAPDNDAARTPRPTSTACIRQSAPAAVRLVGLLPPVQVRRRDLRARRPRAVRGPRRAARRVLPHEAVPGAGKARRDGQAGTRTPRRRARTEQEERQEAELRRVMNKVALVTLWIEPASHQIVKYTFDNINFDFLPGQWLVHVDTRQSVDDDGPAVPGRVAAAGLEVNVGAHAGERRVPFRETVTYHDYREATVTSKVGIPGAPAAPASADRARAARHPGLVRRAGLARRAGTRRRIRRRPDRSAGRNPGPRQRADAGRRNPPAGRHRRRRAPSHPTRPSRSTTRLKATHRFERVEVLKRYASIVDPTAGASRRHRRRRTGEDRRA